MKIIGNSSARRFVLTAALSIGLGFGTHASAVSYLVDLNTRTATSLGNVEALAINDAGRVVGTFSSEAGEYRPRAFITGPNGVGMTDLGTLGGGGSRASGINAAGQVVGGADTTDGFSRAFITGPNGVGMTGLGVKLGGWNGFGFAAGINAAGQVAGSFSFAALDYHVHAVITGPDGVGLTDLGTLGGSNSYATGINAAGQVTGYSYTTNGGYSHAFIAAPNGVGMTDLGTLGGNSSWASGINAAGQVTGYADTTDGFSRAFITGPNGVGMTDLGTLGGINAYSYADGINAAGQVVGYSLSASGHGAFITGPDGVGMTDLNSLVDLPTGVVLDRAFAINNMGQVVASGHISVIPEPASYALMLAGLALISVMARRGRKG